MNKDVREIYLKELNTLDWQLSNVLVKRKPDDYRQFALEFIFQNSFRAELEFNLNYLMQPETLAKVLRNLADQIEQQYNKEYNNG